MIAILLVALVVGLGVMVGIIVLVVVLVRRQGAQPGFASYGQPNQALGGVRLDPTAAWQASAASLGAVGMRVLDAETYMRDFPDGKTMFLGFRVRDGGIRAWFDRPCPGGVLEQYIGAQAEVRPGDVGRSDLAKLVASSVREILGALPRGASLTVKGPEIPGANYMASLSTPLSSPEQAATVVRVLLAVDEAAQRPAPAGAPMHLPPVVAAWQAAGPMLQTLGLAKLDAETYMRSLPGGNDLFVSLQLSKGTVWGWIETPCPGGVLEQFLGGEASLHPGDAGRSEMAKVVAAMAGEAMGALPHGALLTVNAPEIPGDKYKSSLTTPFTSPDQAATVARALLMLDERARMPARGGGHVHLPPVVMAWQAAGPMLQSVGMRVLDAETYMHSFPDGKDLYLSLSVREGSIRGWVDRPCPGGALEQFFRAEAELAPGGAARSEMAAWMGRSVGAILATLPHAARLSVEAPDIPGDNYKASLTTPFSSPEQAATVARVLLSLDAAAQAR